MGYAQRPALWERERRLTDALEGVALLVRAITASAGVTLADLDCRMAPASASLRQSGPDQRWRGTTQDAAQDAPRGAPQDAAPHAPRAATQYAPQYATEAVDRTA